MRGRGTADAVARVLPELAPAAVLLADDPEDAVRLLGAALGAPRALDGPDAARRALARQVLRRPRWSTEQVLETAPPRWTTTPPWPPRCAPCPTAPGQRWSCTWSRGCLGTPVPPPRTRPPGSATNSPGSTRRRGANATRAPRRTAPPGGRRCPSSPPRHCPSGSPGSPPPARSHPMRPGRSPRPSRRPGGRAGDAGRGSPSARSRSACSSRCPACSPPGPAPRPRSSAAPRAARWPGTTTSSVACGRPPGRRRRRIGAWSSRATSPVGGGRWSPPAGPRRARPPSPGSPGRPAPHRTGWCCARSGRLPTPPCPCR